MFPIARSHSILTPLQILKEKMEEIHNGKTPNEKIRLTSPSSFTIRRAGDHTPKGPQRYDPTRTSRGLLPRASGSKRRRAHLDASVIVPPSVPRKQVVRPCQCLITYTWRIQHCF